MLHSKLRYILTILIILTSCIEEYKPEIRLEESQLYVIEGKVTDIPGFQTILISTSSPLDNPRRVPVQNCIVTISDDRGNIFEAPEYEAGVYKSLIRQEFLEIGTAFRLEVITPDNKVLNSGFDTLRTCSEIDTVYYLIEDFISGDPEEMIPGIRFYLDYNGESTQSRKIKIEFEETWKYETQYPAKWIWDGRRLTTLNPPDYSKQICWKTVSSDKIYALSTENLAQNIYKSFPLHNILNNSSKLLQGYSLLIRQLSISEDAYLYFEKINSNILDNGGLYETQPQQIDGNITCISDPGTRILGYFFAAGMKEKRIFISSVEGLPLDPGSACFPTRLDLGYGILRNLDKPVYLWFENGVYLLNDICVDCTAFGGVTAKPDFWPN